MKSQLTTRLKSLSIVLTFAAVMAFAPGQARADEVTVTGFTTATSAPVNCHLSKQETTRNTPKQGFLEPHLDCHFHIFTSSE